MGNCSFRECPQFFWFSCSSFQEQINNDGPITVTHPEVTRYFMTIPEAVRLVLLSTTMASLGEIFILKMGKPLKILDVAHKLLEINGKTLKDKNNPNGDIEINYIGYVQEKKLMRSLSLLTNTQNLLYTQKLILLNHQPLSTLIVNFCLRSLTIWNLII